MTDKKQNCYLIIWNKGAGAGVSMARGSWLSASNPVLRDVHEYILIFSKGSYQRKNDDRKNTITKEQFMNRQNLFGR